LVADTDRRRIVPAPAIAARGPDGATRYDRPDEAAARVVSRP